MSIEETIRRNQNKLLSLPNVTGLGVGEIEGKEVILVFVKKIVSDSQLNSDQVIPKIIEGYKTDVRLEIKLGRYIS